MTSERQSPLIGALHLVVLFSFAVAQPVYDLLGQNTEFFVAHRVSTAGLLIFVLALSLGLPSVLVGLELLAHRAGNVAHHVVHLALVFLLTTAIAAPLVDKLPLKAAALITAASALVGVLATVAYARARVMRSFVTALSPAVLAFPIIFLTVTPVAGLIFPKSASSAEEATGRTVAQIPNPPPIVFIIFDEFEVGALLDVDRNIDPVRFPHFAALAETSWWFRNAVSVRWDTPRAVPAILTGLKPVEHLAPPNLGSHPNNLFTWLANSHEFNVTEPLTSLCPPEKCRAAAESKASGQDMREFLSDIGIIYLHVVTPSSLAAQLLPSMDRGWKGFASRAEGTQPERKTARPEENPNLIRRSMAGDRRQEFYSFVESIKPDVRNTLHFLHILLPHTPYSFLPSGAMYPGGDAEGLMERRVWSADEHLSTVAYHRNMLQIGFVDTAIGRLVEHLKSVGLFESALIVITADHGKSFRPGHGTRTIDRENAPDLLQVPLFIKVPGQTDGQRSDRPVSSIDILPTLADALDVELPWKADGHSMIAPSFPPRESFEILVGKDEVMRFRPDELASYPRLAWKHDLFDSRLSWANTFVPDRYSGLRGRPTKEFTMSGGSSELEVDSDQLPLFEDIDPESGLLPALLQGAIKGAGAGGEPLHLAIAVNGVVETTTKTTAWAGSDGYFITMIPERALGKGRHSVEFFHVKELAGSIQLLPIPQRNREQFRIEKDGAGGEILVSQRTRFPVRAEAVRGYVDTIVRQPNWTSVQGWAVDLARTGPAASVIVFVDGQQVYSGATNISRVDLTRVFNNPDAKMSGFRFLVPESRSEVRGAGSLRVFGVTASGEATELKLSASAQQALRATH